MIKHIVMWKFKTGQEENMNKFLNGLRSLKGQIPEIIEMEVKTNINKNNQYDAVLISTFKTLEDLEKYKIDPRHVLVSNICKTIAESRSAIDIEA